MGLRFLLNQLSHGRNWEQIILLDAQNNEIIQIFKNLKTFYKCKEATTILTTTTHLLQNSV